ncbi:putative mitochondrial pyruvate carrier [Helianthus annuus]|nr:putative mitochondrial pyruvate carrier [Helianthus annuus]
MATSKPQALWNHPAGPETIYFWAPTFKWGISIAKIADFAKLPEKLSYPQQFGESSINPEDQANVKDGDKINEEKVTETEAKGSSMAVTDMESGKQIAKVAGSAYFSTIHHLLKIKHLYMH